MTWWDALPTLGVAVLALLAPGSLVVLAGGVRGLLGTALVPVVSVAVVASAAISASLVRMPFGWSAVLGTVALTASVVAGGRAVARRLDLSGRTAGRPVAPTRPALSQRRWVAS